MSADVSEQSAPIEDSVIVPDDLPVLGVGVTYFPGLDDLFEAGEELIDVVEIEPQMFWLRSGESGSSYFLPERALRRFAQFRQPKLIHSVSLPFAQTAPLDEQQTSALRHSIDALASPWVSDHLSFNRVSGPGKDFFTGFLLPPIQTPQSVVVAADNIRTLRSHLQRPVAFETGVNYLRPLPGEMSDGLFFRSVAEAADCGILLDLHNLWTNACNRRQAVLDTIAELPLERIWEVHLGGGEQLQDHWIDGHSDVPPKALMDLAPQIVSRLPNLKAIVFEISPDHVEARKIGVDGLLQQLHHMHALWNDRPAGKALTQPPAATSSSSPTKGFTHNLPSPTTWEESLGGLVIGRTPDTSLAAQLLSDSGVHLLRHLASMARGGMAVSNLPLTWRLLVLNVGPVRARSVLEEFWTSSPPQLFAAEEASRLGAFLQENVKGVRHLSEVLRYEIASQQALSSDKSQTIPFTCDPLPLLSALCEGRLPAFSETGNFELTVQAPADG